MTREELEQLATDEPQKLALLFALKFSIANRVADHWTSMGHTTDFPDAEYLQGLLTDWTAVINAGKKAWIEWDKMVQKDGASTYWAYPGKEPELYHKDGLHAQLNWPDCAALMIVMIECAEEACQLPTRWLKPSEVTEPGA